MFVHSEALSQQRQHVGVFGGRFDPPHIGHFQLVQIAIQQLGIQQLWVVPASRPVHKVVSGKASNAERFNWLKMMFSSMPQVEVKDWEFQQQPVPTIQTLRYIKRQYPEVLPLWLMGMDAWLQIENWADYPEHQQLCNIAVFQRGNMNMEHAPVFSGWKACSLTQWKQAPVQGAGHVILMDEKIADVSASRIRQDVTGQLAQGAVVNELEQLIRERYK